jgi:protein gp138
MTDALPTFSEIIERALAARVADVHVSMPGEIVSYDPATQTAVVRPGVRRVLLSEDGDQVAEELPPIENVPVSWPGGAGLTIHGVLAAGDTGDIIFSSSSHNEWQATGNVSTPGNLKPHDLGSAKFYPGLRSRKNAAPDVDNSIGIPGGLRLHFGASAVSVGAGAQPVVLETLLVSALSAILTAGAGAGGPGAANFTAAQSALTSQVFAASNLKADP